MSLDSRGRLSFYTRASDPRSQKLVVLADYYVNPKRYPSLPSDSSAYEILRDEGFGLIKMPPLDISKHESERWLRITTDQIEEYSHRGFRLFLLGEKSLAEGGLWLKQLKREMKSRNIPVPQAILPSVKRASRDGIRNALKPILR